MEARQFYNRSINPLVVKSFACKWSEDNRLSVVTEKGLHVLEVIPAPLQTNPILNLSRTFIFSPENYPAQLYADNLASVIYDWEREDVHSILMQDACSPVFSKANTLSAEIIDVAWSPRKLLHPYKCLIAIVTSSGAVELAVQIDQTWISIYDLSTVWAQKVDQDCGYLSTDKDRKLERGYLIHQLKRLLITAVTWSCIYYDTSELCYSYLVTAHSNSEIVIWKVNNVTSDYPNASTNIDVKLKFNRTFDNISGRINALLWVPHAKKENYVLIVGLFGGQIGVLHLEESSKQIECLHTLRYLDEDHIPVDALYVLQQTDQLLKIVVIKGMYLALLSLGMDGALTDSEFISSPGFSITGVSIISSDTILLVTQDGTFCAIEMSGVAQKLVCRPVKLDISKNNIQFLGLANSPNKLLFSLVTSPSIMYDHLANREPSSIYFFSVRNVSTLDPLKIIYRNGDDSMLNYWDCLELLKVNALKHNQLEEILSKIKVDFERLSLHELRIAYWIKNISYALKRRINDVEASKLMEEINLLKSYIFVWSASHHLNTLVEKRNLKDLEKLNVSLLKNQLDIWLAGEDEENKSRLYHYVEQVLKVAGKFSAVEQEKCNICGLVITELCAPSCSSGHKLPRCALTCLQITHTRFRTCIICQEIFHPSLDEKTYGVKCLYCDLPVLIKNEVTDSWLKTVSKNNLSIKKTVLENDSKDDSV